MLKTKFIQSTSSQDVLPNNAVQKPLNLGRYQVKVKYDLRLHGVQGVIPAHQVRFYPEAMRLLVRTAEGDLLIHQDDELELETLPLMPEELLRQMRNDGWGHETIGHFLSGLLFEFLCDLKDSRVIARVVPPAA